MGVPGFKGVFAPSLWTWDCAVSLLAAHPVTLTDCDSSRGESNLHVVNIGHMGTVTPPRCNELVGPGSSPRGFDEGSELPETGMWELARANNLRDTLLT